MDDLKPGDDGYCEKSEYRKMHCYGTKGPPHRMVCSYCGARAPKDWVDRVFDWLSLFGREPPQPSRSKRK